MSWLEKINTDFVITCGDGKAYRPYWLVASKNVEYNTAEFEFRNLVGTLVRRRLPLGTRYSVEIFFQGEGHLEISEAFQASSANPGAWSLQHPYYGDLTVQPLSLTFDNSVLNQTAITGMLMETISIDGAIKTGISPIDKIKKDKQETDEAIQAAFSTSVPVVEAADELSFKNNIDNVFKSVYGRIKEGRDKDSFLNSYNRFTSTINGATYDVTSTLEAVRAVLVMPAEFADKLIVRMGMFRSQFEMLQRTVSTLFTPRSKRIYENNAGLTVSGMILSTVTNITGEYKNRNDVSATMDQLIEVYNLYVDSLNLLQTENGGNPDSYIPDAGAITRLAALLKFALGNLVDISADSRQERTAWLAEDSNIIEIAHSLYGYTGDDSIFTELIESNNIGINEMIILPKGRKIVYYK